MQGIRSWKDVMVVIIALPIFILIFYTYDQVGNSSCEKACIAYDDFKWKRVRKDMDVCYCYINGESFIPTLGFFYDQHSGEYMPTEPSKAIIRQSNDSSLLEYRE